MGVRDQKGITLIEVLIVIVLSTLVMTLVMTALLTSVKQNANETKKLRLQQEANYIITDIQRIHRQCDTYKLLATDHAISLAACTGGKPIQDREISSGFLYKLDPTPKRVIEAKRADASLSLDVRITDPENEKLSIQLTTVISRYQVEGEGSEE